MNETDPHLTDREIDDFLLREGKHHNQLEEHIRQCADCQRKLDAATADAWWWEDGRKLVVSSWRFSEVIGDPPERPDVCSEHQQSKEEIQRLVDHFGTAVHPELLGAVGDYEIQELIGVGGMGAVFKGFNRELRRPVALKFLLPKHSKSGIARQRFAREARAMAAVRNDNVISVFQIDSNGVYPFFAMPLVNGLTLKQLVVEKGMMGPEQLVQIGMQIAAGLQAAHDTGLIHRDVKPSNILLENKFNRVVMTDFGLVHEQDGLALTQTGIVAGTPQYMSPEQANGHQLDLRTDLFSLGSVLYFMATGQQPFKGSNQLDLLKNIRLTKPARIRKYNPLIPVQLERFINRLLQKDPANRFQSAGAARDFLTSYAAYLKSPQSNREPRLTFQPTRNAIRRGVLICGLMTLLTFGYFAVPQSLPLLNRKDTFSVVENEQEAIPLESKEMDRFFSNADNIPQVSGKLASYEQQDLVDLVFKYVIQVPSKSEQTHVIEVNRVGRFDLNLEYAFPFQEVTLTIGEKEGNSLTSKSFLVHRDLKIEIDVSRLRKSKGREGISFSGPDAPMVEYQLSYFEQWDESRRKAKLQNAIHSSTSLESHLQITAETFAKRKTNLDDFVARNPSPYSWILEDDFLSDYHGESLLPYVIHREPIPDSIWQRSLAHQPRVFSRSSSGYYHSMNVAAGKYDVVRLWREILNEHVTQADNRQEVARFLDQLKRIHVDRQTAIAEEDDFKRNQQKYMTPHVDKFVAAVLSEHVSSLKNLDQNKANAVMVLGAQAVGTRPEYIQAIRPLLVDGWCKTLLEEEYQKDVQHARNVQNKIQRATSTKKLGQKLYSADGVHLYFSQADTPEELAESFVESFPDKAIILDFWSMSSEPGMIDMQSSKEVRRQLAELPVEIVYVCLDSKYEQWMETIAVKGVIGHHLFLNKELSAKVSEHFKISSHPSFVFIDQNGNYDRHLIRFLSTTNVDAIKSKLQTRETSL